MSQQAVIEFVNAAESDPDIKRALAAGAGIEHLAEVAQRHGYQVTTAELEPVLSLLEFLAEIRRSPELLQELEQAGDPAAVAGLAKARGYTFTQRELEILAFESADRELSDTELAGVAGGVGIRNDNGLKISIPGTTKRETPKTDFASVVGAQKGEFGSTLAASVAAPFIPGSSVLSAAVSGSGQLEDSASDD